MRPNGDTPAPMRGATNSTAGRRGLVPKPPAASQTKFLRGDGTFQAITGGGDLLAANNLADLASAATARTNLGLADSNTPTFTGLTSPATSNLTLATGSFGTALTVASATGGVGIVGALNVGGTITGGGSGLVLNGTPVIYFGNPSANYLFYDGSTLTTRLGSTDRLTINASTGNVGIGTTSPSTTLEVAGVIKTTDTTASTSSITGALQVAGGAYIGGASVFAGTVTAMLAGNRTGINDDNVASFTPLSINGTTRGFYIIISPDYNESVIGAYLSSGSSYFLYSIVKSANVTLTNTTTMSGTTGPDGKMNIGFNNGIIYIENRLGGSSNFVFLPFGGTE